MTSQRRLEGLDALRGVAALCVVLYHIENISRHHVAMGRQFVSVDLFFVISGFLMARTYEGRFGEMLTPAKFLWIRFHRFFAVMAVGTLLGVLVIWDWWPVWATLMLGVMALLFIPMVGSEQFPLNPPTWSIFAELFANFTHAAVLYRLSWPWLLAISLGFATLMVCQHAIADWHYLLAIPRCLVSYPLGIVLWRINGDRSRAPWWCALVLAAGFPLLAYLLKLGHWADMFYVLIIAPLAVLCGLAAPRIARWPLAALGALSFPIYAVNVPVLELVRLAGGGPLAMLVAAIAVAATVIELERRRPKLTFRLRRARAAEMPG